MTQTEPPEAQPAKAATRRRGAPAPSLPAPAPSPYRWALPAGAEAEEDPLRLRLDFHQESIVVHDYGAGTVRTKLVAAHDVAHALAGELDLTTGLLPRDVLWWARTSAGVQVAVWREPAAWTVRLRERFDSPPRRLRLPMPGLVFVCLPGRQAPYAFAASARPRRLEDQLAACPCFNVFRSGRVCTGSHAFPGDPEQVPEAFFQSFFSVTADTAGGKSRKYPDDVGRLWAELDGQAAFPTDDLVPQLSVADALRLGE